MTTTCSVMLAATGRCLETCASDGRDDFADKESETKKSYIITAKMTANVNVNYLKNHFCVSYDFHRKFLEF